MARQRMANRRTPPRPPHPPMRPTASLVGHVCEADCASFSTIDLGNQGEAGEEEGREGGAEEEAEEGREGGEQEEGMEEGTHEDTATIYLSTINLH